MAAIVILRINITIHTHPAPPPARPGTEQFVYVPRATVLGTDPTHQFRSSVSEPAGWSEWSGIAYFTRLHPVASYKLEQTGTDDEMACP